MRQNQTEKDQAGYEAKRNKDNHSININNHELIITKKSILLSNITSAEIAIHIASTQMKSELKTSSLLRLIFYSQVLIGAAHQFTDPSLKQSKIISSSCKLIGFDFSEFLHLVSKFYANLAHQTR